MSCRHSARSLNHATRPRHPPMRRALCPCRQSPLPKTPQYKTCSAALFRPVRRRRSLPFLPYKLRPRCLCSPRIRHQPRRQKRACGAPAQSRHWLQRPQAGWSGRPRTQPRCSRSPQRLNQRPRPWPFRSAQTRASRRSANCARPRPCIRGTRRQKQGTDSSRTTSRDIGTRRLRYSTGLPYIRSRFLLKHSSDTTGIPR